MSVEGALRFLDMMWKEGPVWEAVQSAGGQLCLLAFFLVSEIAIFSWRSVADVPSSVVIYGLVTGWAAVVQIAILSAYAILGGLRLLIERLSEMLSFLK